VATHILRSRDLSRHDGRSLTRLEVSDQAVIVVVNEHGPARGPDDETRSDRWRSWTRTLEPPTRRWALYGRVYAVVLGLVTVVPFLQRLAASEPHRRGGRGSRPGTCS
jgi:hypothetical protein